MSVDVIIPVFRPDERLLTIINKLVNQSVAINRICIMNTEEKYWEMFIAGKKVDTKKTLLEVKHVSLREFDHGKTRNEGAKGSSADFLLYMTQDAVPVDEFLVENMIKCFDDTKVSGVYARQMTDDNAALSEKFSRLFNYPDTSFVKSLEDKPRLGIKTYFCSNACAMYKREVFEELGTFPVNMIFNEDMVFAHTAIESGYKVAYAADAQVIHYHNYTNMQQFRRNFDLAVSQAMHPEVFENLSSEAEGKKYALSAFEYFCSNKRPFYFIPFAVTCVYRLLGFKLGKNYKKLSRRLILKLTDSPRFFMKNWN